MKKVLMENEKEGVCEISFNQSITHIHVTHSYASVMAWYENE
jgi:hypothetical protein